MKDYFPSVGRIARILVVLVLLCWVVLLQCQLAGVRYHVRILTAVSDGMTKDEVVARLGEPSHVSRDEGQLGTRGEVLVYRHRTCWFASSTVMVLLGPAGRVVTILYPEYSAYPPIGGIAPGEAAQSGPRGPKRSGDTEPFSTIAKRGIARAELVEAIAELRMPPSESPRYWSRIANDSGYSSFHRRSAVLQLVKRHVRIGMRLSELARLLNHPTWLQASDIDAIDFLAGKIPVRMDPRDTVFVLRIMPKAHENVSAIYLRIAGKFDVQSFRSLVLGVTEAGIGDATIVEIGFSEP